jgi:hypothetical protein
MRSLLLCVVIACSSFATLVAQTQITTGVIQGAVVDSSGAVLPGVDVTIVNQETNLTQSRTTDAEGRFVFLQLPPGHLPSLGLRHHRSGRRRTHCRPGRQPQSPAVCGQYRRGRDGDGHSGG